MLSTILFLCKEFMSEFSMTDKIYLMLINSAFVFVFVKKRVKKL